MLWKIFGGLSQEEMHELKRAGDGPQKEEEINDTDEKQKRRRSALRLVINKYIQHDVWPVFEAYIFVAFFAIVF